jgi:hypothetical protein
MSATQTIEIDGDVIGILTSDRQTRTLHFHSGIAPYELLDGSRFVGFAEAYEAVSRLRIASRTFRLRHSRPQEYAR